MQTCVLYACDRGLTQPKKALCFNVPPCQPGCGILCGALETSPAAKFKLCIMQTTTPALFLVLC